MTLKCTDQDRRDFETHCMIELDVAPVLKDCGEIYECDLIQMAFVGWMGKTYELRYAKHADIIDTFCLAMKENINTQQERDVNWQDPAQMDHSHLADRLVDSILNSDSAYEDIALYAMILQQRKQDTSILKKALDRLTPETTKCKETLEECLEILREENWRGDLQENIRDELVKVPLTEGKTRCQIKRQTTNVRPSSPPPAPHTKTLFNENLRGEEVNISPRPMPPPPPPTRKFFNEQETKESKEATRQWKEQHAINRRDD